MDRKLYKVNLKNKANFVCCIAFEVLLNSGDVKFFLQKDNLIFQFKNSQQYFYYCPFCGKKLDG